MPPFPRTEEELAKAGYKFKGTGKCRGPNCGAELAWYETPDGKRMPLTEGTLVPHWGECPDRESFRSK